MQHIAEFCGDKAVVERASIDECFIDLSQATDDLDTCTGFLKLLDSEVG